MRRCKVSCPFRLLTLSYRSGLHPHSETTMPSADFSHAVRVDSSSLSQFQSHATSQGTWEISRGKTQSFLRVNAGFIKHAPFADGGLHGHVPTRPGRTTPHIRFLFVVPRIRIGLPPDPASRRRPCPSPTLRLRENLAWGLPPHQFCAMPGTHVKGETPVLFTGRSPPACWVILFTSQPFHQSPKISPE